MKTKITHKKELYAPIFIYKKAITHDRDTLWMLRSRPDQIQYVSL